ncbi:NmrA family NAD(P)-binding protein [Kineococcus sp. SYSU DK001]|uniref:NmrA family NAD(P)-binding protein n=1 Tax=Kineococcus sp. SYSU DK001 TaxID=3383122 RepID=UPI003D7EA7F9
MRVLVTGATGSVGRRVVDHLLARGAAQVRALTVDPVRAALPAQVEVVHGSVTRPSVLAEALRGVDRLYLAPAPATAERVVTAARRAGVERVVDLSGELESWWGPVAAAVEAGGVPWTHLWPGDFMENALLWAPQVRAHGTVREPWPQAASAPVAVDDIAAVAAEVLLGEGHEGRAHALTGPQVLTRRELAAALGRALGREVPFVRVDREEAVAVLAVSAGEDARWYVDTVLAGFAAGGASATSVVPDLLGRPATTFARWAQQHADAFRG